ncbi:MAG: iron-containing alcohol dehydrogenase, partial [Acidobacteriota bacterium]
EVDGLYGELVQAAGLNGHRPTGDAPESERLSGRLEDLLRAGHQPSRLEDCGVERSRLEQLAAEAAEQWTAQFNPRTVDAADLLGLYDAAY